MSFFSWLGSLFHKKPVPVPVKTPEPVNTTKEPKWIAVARKEIGTAEIPGPQNNPRIIEYGRATDLAPSSELVPWCSIFVNWVFKQCGMKRTNSAAAISWTENWGKKLSKPQYGCVAVYSRTGGNHVTFWIGESGDYDTVLGGNQSDKVCISTHGKSSLRGYYWPLDA